MKETLMLEEFNEEIF